MYYYSNPPTDVPATCIETIVTTTPQTALEVDGHYSLLISSAVALAVVAVSLLFVV